MMLNQDLEGFKIAANSAFSLLIEPSIDLFKAIK